MKVVNSTYKFSFIVPDDFTEISHDEYERYHIDTDATLHVFVKYFDGGVHSISINRDANVKDEEDFVGLVNLNLENLEKVGMHIKEHIHHYNKRARIDTVYSIFKGLKFVTYFTVIHQMMIASSIEIEEINDEYDQILSALFESIEEF